MGRNVNEILTEKKNGASHILEWNSFEIAYVRICCSLLRRFDKMKKEGNSEEPYNTITPYHLRNIAHVSRQDVTHFAKLHENKGLLIRRDENKKSKIFLITVTKDFESYLRSTFKINGDP